MTRPRLAALALALLPACASAQRPSDAPLEEAPAQTQLQALARVTWQPLFERGSEMAAAGDLVRAEQYLSAAIVRGGPPERVLPRLVRVCIAAQRFRAAVEYATPFLARHPDAWALRYLVASIHMGLGEPQTARRHLDLVVQHNPRHAEAHYALGTILRDELSDPVGADAHFRHYLALEPEGDHAIEARAGLLQQVVRP